MYQTGYHATGYHATGYYLRAPTVIEPEAPTTGGGRSLRLPSALEQQRKLAIREDEEMLLALAAFMASRNKH